MQKIFDYIIHNQLITKNDTVIIGLSGGPDSVFLLHLLYNLKKEYNLRLIAAHLDHQWRAYSEKDAIFCKNLCAKLGIPCIDTTANALPPIKMQGSKEAHGRSLRRYFLSSLFKKHHAHSIALGHHEDDQLETFFIRLIRGSSLSGLCGIKPRKGVYIRPLLQTSKSFILSYLHKHNIAYLHDETNNNTNFLRNAIRHTLLPSMQMCDNRAKHSLLRTMQQLQRAERYIDHETKKALALCSPNKQLHLLIFKTLHPYMQQKVILNWIINHQVPFPLTQRFIEEVIRFLLHPRGGTHQIYINWKLVKKQGIVTIEIMNHQKSVEQIAHQVQV